MLVPVKKDADFVHENMVLGESRNAVLEQIDTDIKFLDHIGVMDYRCAPRRASGAAMANGYRPQHVGWHALRRPAAGRGPSRAASRSATPRPASGDGAGLDARHRAAGERRALLPARAGEPGRTQGPVEDALASEELAPLEFSFRLPDGGLSSPLGTEPRVICECDARALDHRAAARDGTHTDYLGIIDFLTEYVSRRCGSGGRRFARLIVRVRASRGWRSGWSTSSSRSSTRATRSRALSRTSTRAGSTTSCWST
jgi:hypothetical protein